MANLGFPPVLVVPATTIFEPERATALAPSVSPVKSARSRPLPSKVLSIVPADVTRAMANWLSLNPTATTLPSDWRTRSPAPSLPVVAPSSPAKLTFGCPSVPNPVS